MKVWEFETAVWGIDGIRIVVRAPAGEDVTDYDYMKAAAGNRTLSDFFSVRIRPYIGDRKVVAINGSGQIVHEGTHLGTIRGSYTQ